MPNAGQKKYARANDTVNPKRKRIAFAKCTILNRVSRLFIHRIGGSQKDSLDARYDIDG